MKVAGGAVPKLKVAGCAAPESEVVGRVYVPRAYPTFRHTFSEQPGRISSGPLKFAVAPRAYSNLAKCPVPYALISVGRLTFIHAEKKSTLQRTSVHTS